MENIKPCPFCGGKARLSYKWKEHSVKTIAPPLDVMKDEGVDIWCEKHITVHTYVYRVQVICNKCYSRGKPVFSKVENYTPYMLKKEEAKIAYEPFIEKAIEAWNKRAEWSTSERP